MPINREGRDQPQPTPPQPPGGGTKWWEYGLQGLERAFFPFAEFGMQRREQGQPWYLPTIQTTQESISPEAFASRAIGGEQYEAYQELPFLEKLKAEAPLWLISTLVPGATKARSLLATKGGIAPKIARGALLPGELGEKALEVALKPVTWPISKAVQQVTKLLPERTVTRPNASYEQLTKIHNTAKRKGLYLRKKDKPNKDYYRVLNRWFGKKHANELSDYEANAFIRALSEVKVVNRRVVLPKGKVLVTPRLVAATRSLNEINVFDRTRQAPYVFEKMGDDAVDLWRDTQWADIRRGERAIELDGYLKSFEKQLTDRDVSAVRIWDALEDPLQTVKLVNEEQTAYQFLREFWDSAAIAQGLSTSQMRKNYVTHIFDRALREAYNKKMGISQDLAYGIDYNLPKEMSMPFLRERFGAEVGLIKDPFRAARAYGRYLYRKQEFQPVMDRLNAMMKFLPDSADWAPTKNYLKQFGARMSNRPSVFDIEINNALKPMEEWLGKLGMKGITKVMASSQNKGGTVAYNLAGIYYLSWLGFKPVSAIRNLSQQLLTVSHVGPRAFANGLGLSEATVVLLKKNTMMWRTRQLNQFVGGLEEEFSQLIPQKVMKGGMWQFQRADRANVINSLKAGYANAKRLDLPDDIAYQYADEVAKATQFLYTKMARSMIEQSTAGRFVTPFTTWPRNFMELMAGWTTGRQSYVLQRYARELAEKGLSNQKLTTELSRPGFLNKRKELLRYMALLGGAYTVKETTKINATEYIGWTSVGSLARILQGELPALTLVRGLAEVAYGVSQNDPASTKRGINRVRPDRFIAIIRQFENVMSGKADWLSLFFYLNKEDKGQRKGRGIRR